MRLLVIGIDGASFRFIDRFLRAGLMPNLARLMERGRHGTLKSTIPPCTAPAWVSCFSGVNPGRHGVFNFVQPEGIGRRKPISSRDVRARRLWHILGDWGWKVNVLDVPLTYPPERVTGVMVSDWMTSGHKRARTMPVPLQEELKAVLGEQGTGAIADGLSVTSGFLEHLAGSVEEKRRLDAYVMAHYPAHAMMTVYQHLDVLSHYFWHLVDPAHPAFSPRMGRRLAPGIKAVVGAIDNALGKTLALAGSDALVVVVSDHGFGGVSWRIYLNDILYNLGVLALADSARRMLWLKRLGVTPAGVVVAARRVDVGGRFLRHISFGSTRSAFEKLESMGSKLDPNSTAAWFPHGLAPGIVVLGREGREKERLVDDLVKRLKWLRTPDGDPCFDLVARREAVYHGPATSMAPDIVVQAAKGVVLTAEISGGNGFSRCLPGQVSGFHRPEGVFIMSGPGVEGSGRVADLSIEDIVPSILAAFGHHDHSGFDGSPAPWINPVGAGIPVVEGTPRRSAGTGARAEPFAFDEDEAAEIARRLEALGYW